MKFKMIFTALLTSILFIFFMACDPAGPTGGCNGGNGGTGGTGGTGGSCDAPTPGSFNNKGQAPSGPYAVEITQNSDFMTHTLYTPTTNGEPINNMPVIVWGNGACSADGTGFAEFLSEIASHGFFIIADGKPGAGMRSSSPQNGTTLIEALDWAEEINNRSCSRYYQKLDLKHMAAMGQSCGGLMTYNISDDPRLTTIIIWNSGLFARNQQIYQGLHTPVAIFTGGTGDVAMTNAQADFNALKNSNTDLPIFWGDKPNAGHMATYFSDNGGEFAEIGIAWLKWQLKGDNSQAGMFTGSNCGLCKDSTWTVNKLNM